MLCPANQYLYRYAHKLVIFNESLRAKELNPISAICKLSINKTAQWALLTGRLIAIHRQCSDAMDMIYNQTQVIVSHLKN
jgi:hypothetical protein